MSATLFAESFRFCNKLRRSKDFAAVFLSRNRSSDKLFLFLAIDNDKNEARLGLAVPKRNVTKAVERNRVKRLIRESFRLRKKKLKGKDVVVFVKKQFDTKQDNIEQTLATHWDRIAK